MPATKEKPKQTRESQKMVGIYVPEEVHAFWTAFAERRGTTLRAEIMEAMRRHTTYEAPPPVLSPPAPLPDVAKHGKKKS